MFRFNNVLAMVIVVGVPAMLLAGKAANLETPELALGAFVTGWALVVQFYFRKAEPKP